MQNLPNSNWAREKSTPKQRAKIDVELRRKLWMTYAEVLAIASARYDRKITDLTQLTKLEAHEIIETPSKRLLLGKA